MGGKKKKSSGMAKGKGKKGEAEEDLSTEKLQRIYRKKCVEAGIKTCRAMNGFFQDYYDEGEHIKKIHIHEEIGSKGAGALMEALGEVNYKHCESLRLWECNIGDEGAAQISKFLANNKSIENLDLLKNGITQLGAEFLGRVLGFGCESQIKILHLDHNPIGSKGVDLLANGLAQNKTLTVLTLTYCGLDEKCAAGISRIMIYISSKLKELDLHGNELHAQGVIDILPATTIAKSLTLLDVSDNQVEDHPLLYENLSQLLLEARSLRKIVLGNNFLSNLGIKQIVQPLSEGKRITEIDLGLKLDPQIWLELKPILAQNKKIAKKSKKKKKKGKKGKKKRKKK